jgi:hypothetical protein
MDHWLTVKNLSVADRVSKDIKKEKRVALRTKPYERPKPAELQDVSYAGTSAARQEGAELVLNSARRLKQLTLSRCQQCCFGVIRWEEALTGYLNEASFGDPWRGIQSHNSFRHSLSLRYPLSLSFCFA